jgi:hypothetical protein
MLDQLYSAVLACSSLCMHIAFDDKVKSMISNWQNKVASQVFGSAAAKFKGNYQLYRLNKDSTPTIVGNLALFKK